MTMRRVNRHGGSTNSPQLQIKKDTVIYVAAPAKVATGGPELLHQLVYNLRTHLGLNAFMYYYPPDVLEPVHPAYKDYNNPFVRKIVDDGNNILVVPEVISGIKILRHFANIQKVIWWLSIDNFLVSYLLSNKFGPTPDLFVLRLLNKLTKKLVGAPMVDINGTIIDRFLGDIELMDKIFRKLKIKEVQFHLYQSYYAKNFLESLGIHNVAYLSDYLNNEFLLEDVPPDTKEDIVAFNPKKGFSFTRKIIATAPDITFVPIKNMSRSEVIQLLKKAKVYIDFGNHPGKDRIPREAAILGCCVVVGKKGSAANPYDVPIPDKYKFEVNSENIPAIVRTIKYCLHSYQEANRDFAAYRESVRQEPQKFIQSMFAIFGNRGD